ncbi:MAG: hypothetical protein ACPGTQ_06595 [Colwellia sp.]
MINLNLSLKSTFFLAALVCTTSCSSYSVEDYGNGDESSQVGKKESQCKNMEPAQKMKCEEQEQALIIGFGADAHCNHPYEYERNRCKSEKEKQDKALSQALKKHTDK